MDINKRIGDIYNYFRITVISEEKYQRHSIELRPHVDFLLNVLLPFSTFSVIVEGLCYNKVS